MNTVTLRVKPSDIQSLIVRYTEKTGVECRACSAEKAFYLDSHVCTKVGDKEIPVGVHFEMLLRVMCRWVVYFRPQVTTVEKAFEVVRFQLCSLEFSLCTVDQFNGILHMKYKFHLEPCNIAIPLIITNQFMILFQKLQIWFFRSSQQRNTQREHQTVLCTTVPVYCRCFLHDQIRNVRVQYVTLLEKCLFYSCGEE